MQLGGIYGKILPLSFKRRLLFGDFRDSERNKKQNECSKTTHHYIVFLNVSSLLQRENESLTVFEQATFTRTERNFRKSQRLYKLAYLT